MLVTLPYKIGIQFFAGVSLNNILKYTTNAGPSGRSPTEIVGSNPTGGMDVCLL